jgi:undecaprenyl-diphosphatase
LSVNNFSLTAARARVPIAIATTAIVWLVMLIGGGRGSALDLALLRSLYVGGNETLTRNATFFTEIGRGVVLLPLALLVTAFLIWRRRRRAALFLIMVIGGRFLVELQKVVIARPRPDESPHLAAVHSLAFPSGHAANAMITALAIALLLPVRQRNRAIAVGVGVALALQIGASRVMLGVHWPSDVVGGWAFGLMWVIICMRLASVRPETDTDTAR